MARSTVAERLGWLVAANALIDAQPLCVDSLAYDIRSAAEYPSRPELYARLAGIEKAVQAIEEAAQLLCRELADPRILGLLSDGDARKIAGFIAPGRFFWNIAQRVTDYRSIAARAAEIRERSRPTQGRGNLYPQVGAGPNEKQHCALIVGLAWQKVSGRWPAKDDPLAHQACERLWREAGGEPHGGLARPDTFTAWRFYIKTARCYRPPHAAGALIESWFQELDDRLVSKERSSGGLRRFYRGTEGDDKNAV